MKSILKRTAKSLGLFPFLKKMRRSVNRQYNFTLNGQTMRGLTIYGARIDGHEELWMGQVLTTLLNLRKGTFMDVGVNIGQTLIMLKSLERERAYIGFEPNPSCNMFVEELIRVNNFNNVQLVPVGIFTEDSLLEMDLYHDEITNTGGSVIKDYWAYKDAKPLRKIMVPLMSVNTIKKTAPLTKVEIMKIDVEGAELEVLQGLKEVIQENSPLIIIEILSAESKENKLRMDRQIAILDLLKSIDYSIFRIIENTDSSLRGMQKIDDLDPSVNIDWCNFILAPNKATAEIESNFKQITI